MDGFPVHCKSCGTELPSVDFGPCPKCGSIAKTVSMAARGFAGSGSMRAELTIVPYSDRLLSVSKKLIEDGEYGVAVVVAHLASEVETQRTMHDAAKGTPALEQRVIASDGYSLNRFKVRMLYNELTGDDVEKSPFWAIFKASSDRRNEIVHKSRLASKEEAEESHEACHALIAHLKK
jgi:hypothetical protein